MGSGFLFVMGFASFETITSYYLMDTFFGGDEIKAGQFYGMTFVFAGITMFVVSGLLYKRMLGCLGEKTLVIVGIILRTCGFVGMAIAPAAWLFAVAIVVQVSGVQFILPTTS